MGYDDEMPSDTPTNASRESEGSLPPDAESRFQEACAAFDSGSPLEALRLLEELPQDLGERWILDSEARLLLDDPKQAALSLERAREVLGSDHDHVVWVEGSLRLHRWDVPGAAECFERLEPFDQASEFWVKMALMADITGDPENACVLQAQGHELFPDIIPTPIRLDPDAFLELIGEAAQDLPQEFRAALEESAVVMDPMPTPEMVGAPESGLPPEILGLFVGVPFSERDAALPDDLPPTICLFQRNLERSVGSIEELREEIRTTLYHELGHALGFDEEGVEEMGLG